MSLSMSTTRESESATGLPKAMRPEALSRRNALGAAAAIALGLTSIGAATAGTLAQPTAIIVSAASDTDLIAFADRLVALARRCDAATDRRIGIEDRIFERCPAPEPLLRPNVADNIDEMRTPTERVFTIRQSIKSDPALVRWEEATAAAKAAHERQQEAMATQLGLHEVKQRCSRMDRRRDRWATDLATMRPVTAAGLAAKTAAVLALLGTDRASLDIEIAHRGDFVMSVLADAVRLGTGGRYA